MYRINKSCRSAAKCFKKGIQKRNASDFRFIHKPIKKLMVANRGKNL